MSPSTLHDGLEALRADRAHEPAASSAVSRLASEFGTPLYVYDRETIVSQFRSLRAAFASRFPKLRIHYALKANGNGDLLAVLRAEGAAPEVVSLGEIVMAVRAGWAGDEILFTSSSKGPEEIAKAVEIGAVLNVDSRDELEQAATSAAAAGRRCRTTMGRRDSPPPSWPPPSRRSGARRWPLSAGTRRPSGSSPDASSSPPRVSS